MSTFPLYCEKGHLYMTVQGRDWLVDTGSPSSFGHVNALELGEKVFHIPSANPSGVTIDNLMEFTQKNMTGLLGMDVLGHMPSRWELHEGRVRFASHFPLEGHTAVPVTWVMGLPRLQIHLNDKPYEMYLDSGATLSYLQLPKSEWAQHPSGGRFQDFHPLAGHFETDTKNIPFQYAGNNLNFRFGHLPPRLEMMIFTAGASGVLGVEFFKSHVVTLFPDASPCHVLKRLPRPI